MGQVFGHKVGDRTAQQGYGGGNPFEQPNYTANNPGGAYGDGGLVVAQEHTGGAWSATTEAGGAEVATTVETGATGWGTGGVTAHAGGTAGATGNAWAAGNAGGNNAWGNGQAGNNQWTNNDACEDENGQNQLTSCFVTLVFIAVCGGILLSTGIFDGFSDSGSGSSGPAPLEDTVVLDPSFPSNPTVSSAPVTAVGGCDLGLCEGTITFVNLPAARYQLELKGRGDFTTFSSAQLQRIAVNNVDFTSATLNHIDGNVNCALSPTVIQLDTGGGGGLLDTNIFELTTPGSLEVEYENGNNCCCINDIFSDSGDNIEITATITQLPPI